MTQWLVAQTTNVLGGKIEHTIKERPLIHCCSADDHFADVNVDIRPEVHPDKVCDITKRIPYPNDSFAAAFADFPWKKNWMVNVSNAMKEMLRVAPVVYTISPWTYGARTCTIEQILVSRRPGVNHPILFIKYRRKVA